MKDDRLYLIHIKECIERVKSYTEKGKENFFEDTKTQGCCFAQSSDLGRINAALVRFVKR